MLLNTIYQGIWFFVKMKGKSARNILFLACVVLTWLMSAKVKGVNPMRLTRKLIFPKWDGQDVSIWLLRAEP